MKKLLSLALACSMLALFCACGETKQVEEKAKAIGVSMPSASFSRWEYDSKYLQSSLEKMDYKVDLRFAESNNQKEQIREMIAAGVSALVVTADDPNNIADVLQEAADKKIKVIAYDRMPTGTEAVDALVTYNGNQIGKLQAITAVSILQLENGGKGSIVLIGGAKSDKNASFLYDGAMEILQPYIDSGALAVTDRKIARNEVLMEDWSAETAKERMRACLKTGSPDVVLCGNDTLALAAAAVFDSEGSGKRPAFIGQDCDDQMFEEMLAGQAVYSIFKDTAALARQAALIANDLLIGKMPGADGVVNNGVKDIPSYFLPVFVIHKDNIQDAVIDHGYYTPSSK